MRIVCISDTHGQERKIKNMPLGDVLVVAGDFCGGYGDDKGLIAFNAWLGELPYKHKICVAGNHDKFFFRHSCAAEKMLSNAIYLQDSMVSIDGLNFYGSPWTPRFMNWYFMKERGEDIARMWRAIDPNTDVLITHGPPQGIMDFSPYGQEHVGCANLFERVIWGPLHSLKLHVFGHLHTNHGVCQFDKIQFAAASVVDEDYIPVYQPLVIDINSDEIPTGN